MCIRDSIKQVYDVLMRTNVSYNNLKYELIDWFGEYLKKQTRSDLSTFNAAQILPTETIPLYALRLQGLAERAFPGSDVKTMKVIREKLINSLPVEIQDTINSLVLV